MSVQTDQSLQWVDFEPIASKIPADIFYQSSTADSASTSGFSFYIVQPASNAMMDNEVYIEYTLQIANYPRNLMQSDATLIAGPTASYYLVPPFLTTVADTANTNPNPTLPAVADMLPAANASIGTAGGSGERVALRQCWPIARSFQNISVNINGTVISHQPVIWMDQFNRLYVSEEEAASLCTLSGGDFGCGEMVATSALDNLCVGSVMGNAGGDNTITVANLSALTLGTSICAGDDFYNPIIAPATGVATKGACNLLPINKPNNKEWRNYGFENRFHRLVILNRDEQAANAAATARYAATFSVTVYERLPISPFLLYNSRDYKMSIPHVKTMNINVQFASLYNALILESSNSASTCTVTPCDSTHQPKLHIKWYMARDPLPPSIRIPVNIIREYIYSSQGSLMNAADVTVDNATITFSNINLEGIPDLMLIYLARNYQNATINQPSEHNAEITSLMVTVAGTSGKLNALSTGELYSLWLRNVAHNGVYKMNYDKWRKRACVAALRPRDYGATFGPGMDYPIQISIQIGTTQWWNLPALFQRGNTVYDTAAGQYNLYLVCVYNRFSLELNSSGGSRLDMLRMPINPSVAISGNPQ